MGGFTVICPKCKLVWRIMPIRLTNNKQVIEDMERQGKCVNCGTRAETIWDYYKTTPGTPGPLRDKVMEIIKQKQAETLKDMEEIK